MFTGGAVKYFDYRINRIKHEFEKQIHYQSSDREDLSILKKELEDRKSEIKHLEEQLDIWKEKYYEMLEHLITLRGKLNGKSD